MSARSKGHKREWLEGRRRFGKTPTRALYRLEIAARGDMQTAKLILGLFNAALGSRDAFLFPDHSAALSDVDLLPRRLRVDARALLRWAESRAIILNELIGSRTKVIEAVYRMRRASPFGRCRLRIANKLCAKYPALKPDDGPVTANLQSLEILSGDVGRPVGPGTIARISAFQPSSIEIRRHGEPWYAYPRARSVMVALLPDGYSIQSIVWAVAVPPGSKADTIHGTLVDFSETGTEGVVWSVEDDDVRGYNGLHPINEGDHLTILDQLGRPVWKGMIKCDRESGWKRYPLNPEYGQPVALGRYVHWTQSGFTPDNWAGYFIRPYHDRLRAILKRRRGGAIGTHREQ